MIKETGGRRAVGHAFGHNSRADGREIPENRTLNSVSFKCL
jgi:hypothetical protein|nr:MAG TPA: hypothetical protein [Caudoviricetes sp.]